MLWFVNDVSFIHLVGCERSVLSCLALVLFDKQNRWYVSGPVVVFKSIETSGVGDGEII